MKPRILTLYNELIKELKTLGWAECGELWSKPKHGVLSFEDAVTLERAYAMKEELKQNK